jgi:hypothetical protein
MQGRWHLEAVGCGGVPLIRQRCGTMWDLLAEPTVNPRIKREQPRHLSKKADALIQVMLPSTHCCAFGDSGVSTVRALRHEVLQLDCWPTSTPTVGGATQHMQYLPRHFTQSDLNPQPCGYDSSA